jgi:hypothetical protein
MSTRINALSLAVALLAAAGAQAAGSVEVRWVQPELFSDIGTRPWERESTLKALGEYLQQLGRQLPDGQTLQLEVTDVDLAGEIDHATWHETRILRGRADWPRIALRYTLLVDGRAMKAGEARLSDLGYLGPPYLNTLRQTELGYEKQMLERWFRDTFAAP